MERVKKWFCVLVGSIFTSVNLSQNYCFAENVSCMKEQVDIESLDNDKSTEFIKKGKNSYHKKKAIAIFSRVAIIIIVCVIFYDIFEEITHKNDSHRTNSWGKGDTSRDRASQGGGYEKRYWDYNGSHRTNSGERNDDTNRDRSSQGGGYGNRYWDFNDFFNSNTRYAQQQNERDIRQEWKHWTDRFLNLNVSKDNAKVLRDDIMDFAERAQKGEIKLNFTTECELRQLMEIVRHIFKNVVLAGQK